MTIPSSITTELSSLQQQLAAATPLASASRATVQAIKLNAANLVDDIQSALVAPSTLDTWTAPSDPAAIVAGILSVSGAASDQSALSLMRGTVGRAAANLDQIPT